MTNLKCTQQMVSILDRGLEYVTMFYNGSFVIKMTYLIEKLCFLLGFALRACSCKFIIHGAEIICKLLVQVRDGIHSSLNIYLCPDFFCSDI